MQEHITKARINQNYKTTDRFYNIANLRYGILLL